MDQNEKLGMYGICFVAAIDGKSFMIMAAAAMFIKNNLIIYDQVYRKVVEQYGLWRRVIVDHGTEFFLSLDVHQKLHTSMGYINYDDRDQSIRQVPSLRNNRIERLWVDVNRIVIYPLKTAIRILEFEHRIDCLSPHHLFSVSQVLIKVADGALDRFVRMWNSHNIQGKGRPNEHVQFSRTLPVNPNYLLSVQDAAAQYPGELRDPYEFGEDLLVGYPDAIKRRNHMFENEFLPHFCRQIISQNNLQYVEYRDCFDLLYCTACNKFFMPLQEAVLEHIRLSALIYNLIE